jgi:hypothetical protein
MSLVVVLFSALLSFASSSHVLTVHGGSMVAPSPRPADIGAKAVTPSDTTGGGPMLVPPSH